MADAKHTQLPWAQGRTSPLAIVAASGQIVADVGHPRDFHLLLAAPELLAALIELRKQINDFCIQYGEADFYTGDATAAIAKATWSGA
jgi:hypothetical protein